MSLNVMFQLALLCARFSEWIIRMTKNEILIGLSESERTAFGKQEFAVQSLPQKVFSSIWAVESEVNNGGFSQYFVNSSAETAPFPAVC